MSSAFKVTSYNGFLPIRDPVYSLPERFSVLESLLQRMSLFLPDNSNGLLFDGKFGEAVEKELPLYEVDDITDPYLLAALFRDYTFAASAYLLEPADLVKRQTGTYGVGREKLPKNLAVPLCKISEKLDAKPFMEYALSYALQNYRRIDPDKPIELDNLELIRKFSGLKSEKGFILVHVDMVRHTPKLIQGVNDAFSAIQMGNMDDALVAMTNMHKCMISINKSMEKMWKHSNPSDYMRFRTFIMGTKSQPHLFPNGVVYEGVSDEPRFYRGESGANDSIIPTMDNFLQLTELMPENEMTKILKDFRSYRPASHNNWLTFVEEKAKVVHVRDVCLANVHLCEKYIDLVEQVREFRARHWNFAKEYIMKHTRYPQATGGSPMSTWLPNQLKVVLQTLIDAVDRLEHLQGYMTADYSIIREKCETQLSFLNEQMKDVWSKM